MPLIPAIFRSKKKRGLYYLLPGMNTSNRRRRREIFRWSLLVGIIVSALFGCALYFLNSR
jgi:hypothetical protein